MRDSKGRFKIGSLIGEKTWFKEDHVVWNKGISKYGSNLSNKERKKFTDRTYYDNHKKQILKNNKEYRKKHKKEFLQYRKTYVKKYPERILEVNKRYIIKQAKLFNLKLFEYKMALLMWSKSVKKRDNNICVSCGKNGEHADHILPKKDYPELALEISNGRTLCVPCHYDRHGWKI